MLRKALFIIALTGLACGSHESTTGGTGAAGTETPAVSAVQPPGGAAAPTMEVTTCLELVSTGRYTEAVEICQTAASQDPSNTDVATALAKANAAAAPGSTADAAGQAAAGTATGEGDDSAGSDEKAAD